MKSPFRTLFAVYTVATICGLAEYIGVGQGRNAYDSPIHNLSAAVSRLYPNTSEAEFQLGRQFELEAHQGYDRNEFRRNPDSFKKYLEGVKANLTIAARHYQNAIELGLKSEEDLYYHYAMTLIHLQEDPTLIDRAIVDWRRNFPFSEKPDLNVQRKLIEETLHQLP